MSVHHSETVAEELWRGAATCLGPVYVYVCMCVCVCVEVAWQQPPGEYVSRQFPPPSAAVAPGLKS